MPQKQASLNQNSTCSVAPTPATTPRACTTSSHHAQAARATQALLLQVQAQLKAHRSSPEPPPQVSELSDTESTTAHWQTEGDSETTPTATATATTAPSTHHPESPQKQHAGSTSGRGAGFGEDLPVSTCSHIKAQEHTLPAARPQTIPADVPAPAPTSTSTMRRTRPSLAHIHEACAASARLRHSPIRPTSATPSGGRGCREANHIINDTASAMPSFSMRIQGGVCAAAGRNSRQARDQRMSQLFARPVSYSSSRSIALKPRQAAARTGAVPGGHHT